MARATAGVALARDVARRGGSPPRLPPSGEREGGIKRPDPHSGHDSDEFIDFHVVHRAAGLDWPDFLLYAKMGTPEGMSGELAPVTDVRPIMAEIRRRARGGSQRLGEFSHNARPAVPTALIADVARLHTQALAIRSSAERIGEMPPLPPTLRGRLGAILVRLIRRALFWIIPSLRSNQQQVADALCTQAAALNELVKSLEQTNARLELLLEEQASRKDRAPSA